MRSFDSVATSLPRDFQATERGTWSLLRLLYVYRGLGFDEKRRNSQSRGWVVWLIARSLLSLIDSPRFRLVYRASGQDFTRLYPGVYAINYLGTAVFYDPGLRSWLDLDYLVGL